MRYTKQSGLLVGLVVLCAGFIEIVANTSDGGVSTNGAVDSATDAHNQNQDFKDPGFELEEDEAENSHHEPHVTEVVKVLAVCLFGFLIMNFSLLYLVNYRDENVRCYIYNMISVTISIFCAVMLNQAVNSFFLKQILVSPYPRGFNLKLGIKEKFLVYLSIFTAFFCLINFLCYKFRERETHLYAVATIGGHLCAFAGIFMFGELQQSAGIKESLLKCVGILVASFFFLALCRFLSAKVREKVAEKEEGSDDSTGHTYTPLTRRHEEEEEEKWEEMAAEAEDEAAVLIMSYLMLQCICFFLVGRLPNIEREYHHYSSTEVWLLLRAALFFLILMLPATTIQTSSHAKGWLKRIIKGAQTFVSLSFCWCIQTVGEWQFLLWLEDAYLSAVITAFVMSGASVILIVLLDYMADILRRIAEVNESPMSPVSAATSRTLSTATSRTSQAFKRLSSRMTPATSVAGRAMTAKFGRRYFTGIEMESLQTWKSWEKALRTIIAGFGLLVGLSWDKAFDVAELGLVAGFESSLTSRPVISRILLGFSLVAFVLPAWIWYIVPLALKSEIDIKRELELLEAEMEEYDEEGLLTGDANGGEE